MYFVNAAGPLSEMDTFVMNNLVPYDIQLVNSESRLDSTQGLSSFDDHNRYDTLLKKIIGLCKEMNIDTSQIDNSNEETIDVKKVDIELNEMKEVFDNLIHEKKALEIKKEHKEQLKRQIVLIQGFNIKVEKFFKFEFMKFRFGQMPRESYEKLIEYRRNVEVITFELHREGDDVFLAYFMPRMARKEVDEFFQSIYFKRIRLSDEIHGHPKKALVDVDAELTGINDELAKIQEKIEGYISRYKDRTSELYSIVSKLCHIFSARQYAIHTKEAFYLTGWVPSSKIDDFVEETKKSNSISFVVEEDEDVKKLTPPTKLNNSPFFKPFEALISMYGVPNYRELDPTIFVSITYLLMFGIMFGDVGQGLVIALAGGFLYKKTRNQLGLIAIYLGISSMISGVFYGSLFGNEEFLREHLSFIPMFNPMENQGTILIVAIGFGVVLILLAMVLNIMNAVKSKKFGKLLFDRNGVVGVVVYFAILYVVLNKVIALEAPVLPAIILICVSFALIVLSHPLQKLFEGKKEFLPKDKTGFFIEAFFELIETILAIMSNTISFMRVGAFALNHVGFFMAFHMLSEMVEKTTGQAGSIAVMVFGNLLIIVLEGLIVAIQGLRLEYYELFSRFFIGEGIEYKPFFEKKRINKI